MIRKISKYLVVSMVVMGGGIAYSSNSECPSSNGHNVPGNNSRWVTLDHHHQDLTASYAERHAMSEMAKEEYLKLRDGVIPQLEETIANAEKNDVFNLLLRHKAAKEAAEKQQLIMKSSTLEGEKKEEEEEGERASAYSSQSSSISMTTEDPVVAELEHQIGGKASEVLDLVLLLMSSISRSHEELKEIDGHLGLIAYEGIPHANDDNIRHILGVFKTMGHQPAPAPYTLPHQLRQSHQSTDSSSSSSSSSSFNASSLSMTEKKPS